MRIEKEFAGAVMCLLGLIGDPITIVRPSFDLEEDEKYTWWKVDGPESRRKEIRENYIALSSRIQQSNYNEMYLYISGCKETTYTYSVGDPDKTFIWGIFHRDGRIKGFFHYMKGQDKKKDGQFFIVRKSTLQPEFQLGKVV